MYNSLAFIIGHFIGDYLLQTHKQATKKTEPTRKGRLLCFEHCTYYALVVAGCVALLDGWKMGFGFSHHFWWAFLIAFISHYPIDRFGLGWKWMKLMKQTNFMDTVEEQRDGRNQGPDYVWYRITSLRAFFVPIVYVAVDNTMHIFLMWIMFSKLGVY